MSRSPRTAVAMTPLLPSLRPARSPCVRSGAEQSHPPARNQRLLTLSPRWPGGEGRVRGADEAAYGAAHLTLPPLSAHACVRLSGDASPMRQGPLPLPPEGRRGALANGCVE